MSPTSEPIFIGIDVSKATLLYLAGYARMVVNSRQAHDFAKALGYLSQQAKTDFAALVALQALSPILFTGNDAINWLKAAMPPSTANGKPTKP